MPTYRDITLSFPLGGLDEYKSFTRQPEGTAPDVQNVRPHDPGTGRARGAQRSGLSKYLAAQLNSSNQIPCLDKFVTSNAYSAANTLGVRTVKGIGVAGGTVKTFTSGGFATPTNGSSAFSSTAPVIYSTNFFDDVYFCDGTNTKYYDSSADTVSTWSASAGSFPVSGSDYPRLICTYNNRIVLSGLDGDPQNFFATAAGTPGDFDYSPATITSEIAFAGNAGNAATIPDKIMALAPIPDSDVLIFGCDHSIFQMSGDVAAGGRIDRLSDTVGMAWGRPYCFNPQGLMYFFGSRGGVYAMAANSKPRRLTGDRIDERLASVDLSDNLVQMLWDDRQQGAHLFITPLDNAASTNYFYDQRTDSWWKDVFATANHNPTSTLIFDGDTESDRAGLIGTQDGYIQKIDTAATNDDATAISSHVYFGPLYYQGAESVRLLEITGILAAGSSDVTFEIFSGDNIEEAFNATVPAYKGTWSAERNYTHTPRTMGGALFIKVSNTTSAQTWSIEKIDVRLTPVGHSIYKSQVA